MALTPIQGNTCTIELDVGSIFGDESSEETE